MIKNIFLVLTLLTLTLSTIVPHVGPVKSHIPRTYKVNLDDEPIMRWKQIIHDY